MLTGRTQHDVDKSMFCCLFVCLFLVSQAKPGQAGAMLLDVDSRLFIPWGGGGGEGGGRGRGAAWLHTTPVYRCVFFHHECVPATDGGLIGICFVLFPLVAYFHDEWLFFSLHDKRIPHFRRYNNKTPNNNPIEKYKVDSRKDRGSSETRFTFPCL